MQSQQSVSDIIPSGWRTVTLEELSSDKRHSIKRGPWGGSLKKEFFVDSGYKVYEQKNVIYNDFKIGRYYIDDKKFSQLKEFEIMTGELLISCSGTFGKIAIVPPNIKKGIINQALLKVNLNERLVLNSFFKYLFESELVQNYFFGLTHGSAIKNIVSVSLLKRMRFALPPLIEQQKIVSIITNVDKLIQRTDQIIDQTQRLKKALMDRLLTKGVAHSSFKKTDAGTIPEEWQVMELGKVLSMCQYGFL